ncbi:MAG: type IV toxin-antitoxin system AbiEi family antitoxin domain-containing protein [Solirubrobacteraceae bacterium]
MAADQHGVVSARQLQAAGLNRPAVQVRVRNGRLHPVHRGVYAVGHGALTLHARFMAATLACGPAAVLSHRSAGALWGFLAWETGCHPEVMVPDSSARCRRGLRVHRTRALDSRDVTRRDAIAVTTPAGTLLDLADDLPANGLRRTMRQAQAMRWTNVRQIADVLTRANGRRGAHRLAALIADGPAPTRSEFEDVVLDLVLSAGLRRPEINERLGSVFPDLRWPDRRLTVECDGAAWHDNKLARENDAERQARLEAGGERVLRVTWQQAVTRPQQTLARFVAAGAPCTDRRA